VDELKSKAWIIIAALGGGFLGQYISDEPLTRPQRIGFIVSGVCTALFLIPWGLSYYGATQPEATSGASFLAGIFWKPIIMKAGGIIDFIRLPFGEKKPDE